MYLRTHYFTFSWAAPQWVNSIWLCSCKIYYTDASLLWVFLFRIKCDSCIDCAPRPSALSEAILFYQQSSDRQHCLSNERKAISRLDLALLCGSSHALRDVVLDFFPSVGQVLFLVDATLSLAMTWTNPRKTISPRINQEELWRQHRVLLLSSPFLCKQRSKETSCIGVQHDERVQRRPRPGRRRRNVLKEPKLF